MASDKPQSIWPRAFALLCLAEFLGYAQHLILQPTFPRLELKPKSRNVGH